jgi:predicted ThiF/HesA family dinucleotide-utilizing enzyme
MNVEELERLKTPKGEVTLVGLGRLGIRVGINLVQVHRGGPKTIKAIDGQKISETINTYEVKTAGPQSNSLGFPALVEVTKTVWEENQTFLTTKDTFTYDAIGNIIERKERDNAGACGQIIYLYC